MNPVYIYSLNTKFFPERCSKSADSMDWCNVVGVIVQRIFLVSSTISETVE